jgi:hypothetical protein
MDGKGACRIARADEGFRGREFPIVEPDDLLVADTETSAKKNTADA